MQTKNFILCGKPLFESIEGLKMESVVVGGNSETSGSGEGFFSRMLGESQNPVRRESEMMHYYLAEKKKLLEEREKLLEKQSKDLEILKKEMRAEVTTNRNRAEKSTVSLESSQKLRLRAEEKVTTLEEQLKVLQQENMTLKEQLRLALEKLRPIQEEEEKTSQRDRDLESVLNLMREQNQVLEDREKETMLAMHT